MNVLPLQNLTSSPPVPKALTEGDAVTHSAGMSSAATLIKGFAASISSLAVFGWAEWLARAESWLKLCALLLGGAIVPVYTLVSMWKQNRNRDIEAKILEKKLRDDV